MIGFKTKSVVPPTYVVAEAVSQGRRMYFGNSRSCAMWSSTRIRSTHPEPTGASGGCRGLPGGLPPDSSHGSAFAKNRGQLLYQIPVGHRSPNDRKSLKPPHLHVAKVGLGPCIPPWYVPR